MADALAPLQLHNVHPKEARKALVAAPGLLSWVTISAEDEAAASKLVRLEHGASSAADYAAHFRAAQLSASCQELSPAVSVALLRALALAPSDRFLDLGSARGALVLAAAATTPCARCAGVELSPSLHAVALEAQAEHVQRHPADGGGRVAFLRADLRDAPLDEYSVFVCGVRRSPGSAELMRQLVEKLARPPPAGRPRRRRLVTVGFGLELRGASYEGSVALTRAYAFRSVDGDALPLYSDENVLPGVLFEYEICHRDASDDDAGARQADAKAATDRWAERCKLAGIGFVADEQRQLSAVAPPLGGGGEACTATGAADDADGGAAAAIDLYLAQCESGSMGAALAAAPREACRGCGRRKRWYCARCRAWLPSIAPPAALRLPFSLDVIVRDDLESATGIHAAALASPVQVVDFPAGLVERRYDPETTYVLYPTADALTAAEVVDAHGPDQLSALTVLAIDSKWNNDGAILAHPSLRGLRHLRLRAPPSRSRIWRTHAKAIDGCVSTIEALYCLLREVHDELGRRAPPPREPPPPVEGLLLLFAMTRLSVAADVADGELPPFAEEAKAAARERRRGGGALEIS